MNADQLNRSVQLVPSGSNVLTVWFDTPERNVNILDAQMIDGLASAIEHIESNPTRYHCVLFRSRKPGCFFVGADVNAIANLRNKSAARKILQRGQDLFSRIANLDVPTIAAMDGVCLGGGLEFALACKHRVASDSSQIKLGLPEIKLGLIPGWGGTQRLPQLVGLRHALHMILSGKSHSAPKAHAMGLIERIIPQGDWEHSLGDFVGQVASGLVGQTAPRRKFRDWLLDETAIGRRFVLKMASRKISEQATHFPALPQAIQVIAEGCRGNGNAFDAECEGFLRLLFSNTARNLLQVFVSRDRARKIETWVEARPAAAPPVQRVAVIGAGAMGAGIAVAAARKGFDVVLKEVDRDAANRGQKRVQGILQDAVDRKRLRAEEMTIAMKKMRTTTDWQELRACDLAIEAVLEIESVKQDVFRNLDRWLPGSAVFASNTSSLSVSRMPTAGRRNQTAGLHFFNPVERMDLVEVVRTESTNEFTVARLLEFVRALGKTPVVTSDKPGFLVNRILFPYLGEAVRLMSQGGDAVQIDRQMLRFGMPMGPLALMDQVGVDIAAHVADSLNGHAVEADGSVPLLAEMVHKGWLGKKSGQGFYLYGKNVDSNTPNPWLSRSAVAPPVGLDFQRDGMTNTQRQLVYPMLNEAVHCLDELVASESWMVDLSMVLGTGFAPMHGGPLRLIDTLGAPTVLHNMRTLQSAHGDRFAPADGLLRAVRRSECFFSTSSTTLTWEKHHEPRYSSRS